MKKIKNFIRSLGSTRYLIHRIQKRFIANFVKSRNFNTVVDVGAGKSPYRKFVKCKKYIGVDIENRGGVENLILADINKGIPLDDETADLVIMTEVLEHLREPKFVLGEIFRILKKGGVLLLTTPMTWPLHEVPNDFFRYTCFGLRYLLEETGFSDINIKPGNKNSITLVQLVIQSLRRLIFKPLVVIFNLLGLVILKLFPEVRNDMTTNLPIDYQVIALKNGKKNNE
jgi:SAM-dependent methyltransferase